MAKYEILTIIDGKLDEKNANLVNEELLKMLEKTQDLKVTDWGNRELAYPIKKRTLGYYHIYNFSTNDSDIIREFRRLTNINQNVLRYLIINLDKDYGAKAINNEKKLAKSKIQLQRYEAIQAKKKQEFAARGGETSLKRRPWNNKKADINKDFNNKSTEKLESENKTVEASEKTEKAE